MEKEKNGWKELVRGIQYDIQVVKETMLHLDRKVSEMIVKHSYLERKVEKMEDDSNKRQAQTFYALLGGIISFLSGLILFLFSFFAKGGGK